MPYPKPRRKKNLRDSLSHARWPSGLPARATPTPSHPVGVHLWVSPMPSQSRCASWRKPRTGGCRNRGTRANPEAPFVLRSRRSCETREAVGRRGELSRTGPWGERNLRSSFGLFHAPFLRAMESTGWVSKTEAAVAGERSSSAIPLPSRFFRRAERSPFFHRTPPHPHRESKG